MSFFFHFFIVLFLVFTMFLTFIILIQDSKSMGLGASFGGGESGDSLFGTSTADVLKKFTAYLIAIFMAFCLFLSLWTTALGRQKAASFPVIEQTQQK